MSDSENELPSDEEDDDYVPSGEEVQEEPSEGEESEPSGDDEDDDDADAAKRKVGERQSARLKKTARKTEKANLKRGRTRRGISYGEEESSGSGSVETPSKKAKSKPETEGDEKKRVDDLWASFLSDVNQPKSKPTSKVLVQKGTKIEVQGGDSSSSDLVSSSTSSSKHIQQASSTSSSKSLQQASTSSSSSPTKSSEKITITKVFDFAGEEIKVTKEVSLDSEEAKEELAKRVGAAESGLTETASSEASSETETPKATGMETTESQKAPADSSAAGSAASTLKPSGLKTALLSGPSGSSAVDKILSLGKQTASTSSGGSSTKGGLANIMDKISSGPKKKLSVLDKTALDWKNFKDKEGISEELATFNKGKGGFLEKQKFLQQSDYRQFEAERNMRMGKR